jgi:RNA polymerase sigma factor (sigma-70 family)
MRDDREAAFSGLFRRHHPAVRRYVARRAWPDAVDDVVAQTFLVAWRRFEDVPADPLPWLLTTAGHCLANHRRSAARGAALLERLRAEPAARAGDDHRGGEQRAAIVRAFATLSDAERETVMLVEWDGLSPAAAARMLGLNAPQFRTRLYRARRALRRALDTELTSTTQTTPTRRRAHDAA